MARKTNYAAEFKARVAMEAIKGVKGKAEICSEYKIPLTTLCQWIEKISENMHQIFIPESEHIKKKKLAGEEIEKLHMRIIFSKKIRNQGLILNGKKVLRIMQEIGIEGLYPKQYINTTIRNNEHKTYPYMLTALEINKIDQVWATDIT